MDPFIVARVAESVWQALSYDDGTHPMDRFYDVFSFDGIPYDGGIGVSQEIDHMARSMLNCTGT